MGKLSFKRLAFVCLIGFLVFPFHASAQSKQNKSKSVKYFDQALEYYQKSAVKSSEELLLSSIKFDSLNVNAYLLLSDVSDELQKSEQRIWALEKVLDLDSLNHPVVYKFLAELYFPIGKYQQSLYMWLKYKELATRKDSLLIDENIQKCRQAIHLVNNPSSANLFHLGEDINSSENEYWPLISTDDSTIYFTRLITTQKKFAFERLYFSERTDTSWAKAKQLNLGADEMVNEGTMSMTADADLIFFTACGRPDGKGSCDIYYLQRTDGKWSRPRNAGNVINTASWEAQPSVSANGDRLYFSSNRPGGSGAKDIWMSDITTNQLGELKFSVPKNLGNRVNSRGNDFSPFIHADDQTLYFASDGRYGLGKSDLFFTQLNDSVWSFARNLGSPINSTKDDDGLVVSPSAHLAAFSSDRSGSVNNSKDLYLLTLPDQFQPYKVGYVKGQVFDAVSKKKLNVEIKLVDLENSKAELVASTVENGFITTLKAERTYAFHISEPGYLFYSEHFNLKDAQKFSSATVLNIYLQPIKLNATVVLNNIFFDFNSYELRKESIPELNELIRFMKINPDVRIEISGHTDNIGSEEYNRRLSENRAGEISKFLTQFISSDRIVVKGYGAEKPVDTNETEEGRSHNRRSELRIIGN